MTIEIETRHLVAGTHGVHGVEVVVDDLDLDLVEEGLRAVIWLLNTNTTYQF